MSERSKRRLAKFEKIVSFGQRQLDLIQLELAQKQSELVSLKTEANQLQLELETIQQQDASSVNLTANRELSCQLMFEAQEKINESKSKIKAVNEEINAILDRYQQQRTKVKSWEKIVERVSTKIREDDYTQELVIADDRFLATTPPGRI